MQRASVEQRHAAPSNSRAWANHMLGGLAALVVAWLVTGCFLILWPATDAPRAGADAVLVLGPPDTGHAITEALKLVQLNYANHLVISAPSSRFDQRICRDGFRGIRPMCFLPDPTTTVGEGRAIRRIAAERGWNSIIVVTGTYHVSRTRYVMQKCFPGTVQVVGAHRGLGWSFWVHKFFYESGAWAKALAAEGC